MIVTKFLFRFNKEASFLTNIKNITNTAIGITKIIGLAIGLLAKTKTGCKIKIITKKRKVKFDIIIN